MYRSLHFYEVAVARSLGIFPRESRVSPQEVSSTTPKLFILRNLLETGRIAPDNLHNGCWATEASNSIDFRPER